MSKYVLPKLRVEEHNFAPADLCAGHVVLDFVNTAAGLNRDPRDWLDSYERLLDWARLAGLFDAKLLAHLAGMSGSSIAGRGAALNRARELRAALYTLLQHHREATRPPPSAVSVLQAWCRRAGTLLVLQSDDEGVLWPSLTRCGLDAIAATIAQAAADFLAQPLHGAIGICAGHNCGWMFLDTSRTRRRRWCDMKTCGNAAKASRHYRRQRVPR